MEQSLDLLHNNILANFFKFRLQKAHRNLAYFSKYAFIPLRLFRSKFEKIITKAYCAKGLFNFKFRDFSYTKNYGYTLLETVVALAVILSALVGPVSLVIRGIHNFSFSKNKIIAVNLAQEGIELIRVIRENNQICIVKEGRRSGPPRTWQTDYDGSVPSSILGADRTADALDIFQYSCGSVTIKNPTIANFGAACATTPLRINANGNYNYAAGQPAIFSRCISITRPSGSESGPQGLTIPPADMMDVTSVVSWLERDIPRSISLTERLYNWK